MTTKERYKGVYEWCSANMQGAASELNFRDNFELLVSVILSAQCTDKRVNLVTPALFEVMGTPQKMAEQTPDEIFEYIRSVSYPNAKANHLHKMAVRLCSHFLGNVPSTMEELTSLSGVGRKTANVVMAVAFGQSAMAVDTHVFRVSQRLGLTKNATTPLSAEKQLVAGFPKGTLDKVHHYLILHGRYVCTARNPKCTECGLTEWCKNYRSNITESAKK